MTQCLSNYTPKAHTDLPGVSCDIISFALTQNEGNENFSQ